MSTRHLVLINQDIHPAAVMNQLRDRAGLRVASCADVTNPATAHTVYAAIDGYLLPRLGVAIVQANPDQLNTLHTLTTDSDSGLLAVEAETTVSPAMATMQTTSPTTSPAARPAGGTNTHYTGIGTRVALLSTGINPTHPATSNRPVYGHTILADTNARDTTDYSSRLAETILTVAPDIDLYTCKVLTSDNHATGRDGDLLAGMEWALAHRVDITCLPVARAITGPAELPSIVFDQAARRALNDGMLTIAPVGEHDTLDTALTPEVKAFREQNLKRLAMSLDMAPEALHSDTGDHHPTPVAHPANCPHILAATTVVHDTTGRLRVADYANRGMGAGPGGQVDIAALISPDTAGTAAAAAYVAGVAATHSSRSFAIGWSMWGQITATARRLNQPSTDVGVGLATPANDDLTP